MAKRRFWSGFAAGTAVGAAAGVVSWLIAKALGRQEYSKIMRLEKSVQVGRPIEDAFRAWSDLSSLPRYLRMIERIDVRGKRSHWVLNVAGRRVEWDAELTQNIPDQALGWKPVNGPKHTGRINFARLGHDTLVHVVMNYAPPAGAISSGVVEAFGRVEGGHRGRLARVQGRPGGQGAGGCVAAHDRHLRRLWRFGESLARYGPASLALRRRHECHRGQ